MAKACMINREKKRLKLVLRHADRRAALRAQIKDTSLHEGKRNAARIALNKLPRDSSAVRLRNRCLLTGRPHGYYRKFGLARNKLREMAMSGEVPGLIKASW